MLLLLYAEKIQKLGFHEQILPTLKLLPPFWDFSKICLCACPYFTFNILIVFWASQMWRMWNESYTVCVTYVPFVLQCHQKQIIQHLLSPPCQSHFIARRNFNWFNFENKGERERESCPLLNVSSASGLSQFSNMSFSSMWFFWVGQFFAFWKLPKTNKWANMYWNMANQTIDIKFVSEIKKLYVNKLILIGLQVPFFDTFSAIRSGIMYLTKRTNMLSEQNV